MSYKLDDTGEPICSCHPVQTFLGGPTCKLLTKNAIFQNPENDGSILVCTGDEASNSAMVWDASTGSLLQDLRTDQPVLDICPFEVNQSNYLATLTEKMVRIYRWEWPSSWNLPGMLLVNVKCRLLAPSSLEQDPCLELLGTWFLWISMIPRIQVIETVQLAYLLCTWTM